MKTGRSGAALTKGILAAAMLVAWGMTAHAEKFTLTAKDGGEKFGPFEYQEGETVVIGGKAMVINKVVDKGDEETIKKKLQACRVAHLEMEETSLADVVKHLQRIYDEKNPEDKGGVTFVFKAEGMDASKIPTLSIVVDDIPMLDAIRWITRSADLTWNIVGKTVIFEPEKKK